MKKRKVLSLIIAIIIPLIVGGLSSYITKDAMFVFNSFKNHRFLLRGFCFQ